MVVHNRDSESHLDDVFILIILRDHDFVHDRALPFGPFVGHGAGLVHVIRQQVGGPRDWILCVGGTDFVDVVVPVLNGLPHISQTVTVQQLQLSSWLLLQQEEDTVWAAADQKQG